VPWDRRRGSLLGGCWRFGLEVPPARAAAARDLSAAVDDFDFGVFDNTRLRTRETIFLMHRRNKNSKSSLFECGREPQHNNTIVWESSSFKIA